MFSGEESMNQNFSHIRRLELFGHGFVFIRIEESGGE